MRALGSALRVVPRPFWATLGVVALCFSAGLPTRAQVAGLTPSGAYRIAGRVENGSSGDPMPRVTVAALGEDGHVVQSVQTDSDGRFAMEHMPAGKFPLTAAKRGFRTTFYDEHDEFNSAIVTGPDQDTSNLAFKLMPAGVLHGVVTGDGGDPAENASVILFKRGGDPVHGSASGEIVQLDGTMTDDTGAYEFSNLAAGEYFIAVSTSPWYAMHPQAGNAQRTADSEPSTLDVAYPVTYYDSTTDEASATPIVLAPGSREEADINLHAVPALRLQVAAPRKGANDIVQPELRQMIFGMQVSSEGPGGGGDPLHSGVVEFNGVAPGHYQLMQGDPPRIVELDAASSQDVDPNAGAPAVTVEGVVQNAGGTPIADNLTVILEPQGGRGRAVMQAEAHKGQFRFENVSPGTWSLWVTSRNDGELPVVSVTSAVAVTPGGQITVKDRPLALLVTVSPLRSNVRGVARRDGKGIGGVLIGLVPRQPAAYRALVRFDQSDSDGSFALHDVPAGQYTIIAIEDGWKLDRTARASFTRYLPGGIGVTVSAQAGGNVSLSGPVPVQAR